MNLGEFVSLLGLRCGSRTDLSTRIKTEVAFVQTTVLEGTGAFLPWFLQSAPTNLATVVGDSEVAFPADFLGELEDSMLWYQDAEGNWHKLIKKSYDYILEKNLDSGAPVYYAVGADTFYLAPVPDAVYSLRWRYYQKQAALALDADTNLWLTYAQDLFMAEVGRNIVQYHTQEEKLLPVFIQDAQRARERLFVKHEAMQNVNRIFGMGED